MAALTPDQMALYRTLIDAAQQAPEGLALRRAELNGRPVALVMVKVGLKSGKGFDWMPLAVMADASVVDRLTIDGQRAGAQSPNDYDPRFVTGGEE